MVGSDSDEGRRERPSTSDGGQRSKQKRRKIKAESESDSSSSEESTDSEEERRRRKQKKQRREERREKKREKKKKKKRRKEEEDLSSDEDRKRRLLKEAKKFLKKSKKHKSSLEERADRQKGFAPLTPEYYFQKNLEFATWLREDRGIFFSDLTSDQTHELFKSFIEVYNKGKLPERYYSGISAAPRTSHNWAIKGMGDADPVEEEERQAAERALAKSQQKKWKKDQEVLLDEMLPKATGREALMENKAVRRQQARDRDASPELLKERDVMGGGDDFQQRLARERAWREKKAAQKQEAAAEKAATYNAAEAARLDQFKALINASGGKIRIAKRAPP